MLRHVFVTDSASIHYDRNRNELFLRVSGPGHVVM